MPYSRQKPIDLLAPAEVQAILEVGTEAPSVRRNRALIALLYWGALRVSEALALDRDTVRRHARGFRITVRSGKGKKGRVVLLDPAASLYLELWEEVRPKSMRYLCTREGGTVSRHYVHRMVKRYAERACLNKRVHPHGFRHSRAAQLEQDGYRISTIRSLLGHSNLGVTSAYLDGLSEEKLQEEIWARGEHRAEDRLTELEEQLQLIQQEIQGLRRS